MTHLNQFSQENNFQIHNCLPNKLIETVLLSGSQQSRAASRVRMVVFLRTSIYNINTRHKDTMHQSSTAIQTTGSMLYAQTNQLQLMIDLCFTDTFVHMIGETS